MTSATDDVKIRNVTSNVGALFGVTVVKLCKNRLLDELISSDHTR